MDWEEKVDLVRKHFEKKGYRVHSGLQFGAELVLYADSIDSVHSDFCIHVVRDDGLLDWREIQTLVRSMSDFHKTLILANVKKDAEGNISVDELAVTTEHAPFRHKQKLDKQKLGEVGKQRKMPKLNGQYDDRETDKEDKT